MEGSSGVATHHQQPYQTGPQRPIDPQAIDPQDLMNPSQPREEEASRSHAQPEDPGRVCSCVDSTSL